MKTRQVEHEHKMIQTINKWGNEVKERIIEEAMSEWKKDENKRKTKEAEIRRREIDEKRKKERKDKGESEPV